MKKKNLIYAVNVCVFVLASYVFNGCDVTNPTSGLGLSVNTKARQNPVVAVITDLNGKSIPAADTLIVTVSGADSAKVVDEVNKSITKLSVKAGMMLFCIQDGTVISKDKPVSLTLKVHSVTGNYIDCEKQIMLTKNGFNSVNLKLAKKNSSGTEVYRQVLSELFDPSTGALNSTVNITTPSGIIITIPAGTIMKDASGNILSGNLTVSVTAYLPGNLSAFNLGFFPNPTITSSGSGNTLSSIGGVSIQFSGSSSGNNIASGFTNTGGPGVNPPSFSVPIQGNFNSIPQSSFSPGTSLQVFGTSASGTPISLGNCNVGNAPGDASGSQLYINSQIYSPGNMYDNYYWFYYGYRDNTVSFDFGPGIENQNCRGFSLIITGVNGIQNRYLLGSSNRYGTFSFYGLPLQAYMLYNDIKCSPVIDIVEGQVNYLPVDLSAEWYAQYSFHKYNIFLQGKCPNESADNPYRINPTLYCSLSSLDGNISRGVYIVDGHGDIQLQDGVYSVSIIFNDQTYSGVTTLFNGRASLLEDSGGYFERMPNAASDDDIWYFFKTFDACE